ncbi:hypothetical protein KW835_18500 [Acidovorax sp. sic0104]|nr:hypothetical protein [Acidovorax sp. sic0104]
MVPGIFAVFELSGRAVLARRWPLSCGLCRIRSDLDARVRWLLRVADNQNKDIEIIFNGLNGV